MVMGEFSHNSNLTFTWNITAADEDSVHIGIYPAHPVDVSAHSSPEKAKVIFHDKKMFVAKGGNELATNQTSLRIPPLNTDIDTEATTFDSILS